MGNQKNLEEDDWFDDDMDENDDDDNYNDDDENIGCPVEDLDTLTSLYKFELNESTDNRKSELKLYIPSCMFGFIIGPKGETIQKLQKETSTTVVIPRNKNNQKSRAGQSNRTYQNE